jgi:thiamine-phosphate pyrophosphorylase
LPRARFTFPSRLYPILDLDQVQFANRDPLVVLADWLAAGIGLVQLRAKNVSDASLLNVARQMAAMCHAVGVPAIINDRADIAAMVSADGVHVGQEDLPAVNVRGLIGEEKVLGLSTHSDEQMKEACLAPVDYVAIGPVFTTGSKLSSNPAIGIDGVARAAVLARAAGRPIVAIGGITLTTAPAVIAAGVDAVAVISDLLTSDPARRAREYLQTI